jgi:hypothetical protein
MANCSHYQADCADAEDLLDEWEADHTVVSGNAHYSEEDLRQTRIAAGVEHACANCGCSETRSCDGGCVWATDRLCSRCV